MRFIFVHFMANKLTEIKKKIHIAFAISHSNSNLSKKNAKDFSHNGLVTVCSQ